MALVTYWGGNKPLWETGEKTDENTNCGEKVKLEGYSVNYCSHSNDDNVVRT